MADDETLMPPPPIAFPTFRLRIERMSVEGVPARVDRAYLVDMAVGTQFQYRQSFRSLGLTTSEDEPTQLLHDLVNANPADRPEFFGKILAARYPDLTGLPPDASNDDFFAVLRDRYRVTSEVQRRKMRTFFVAAVSYAKLPISPHIRPARPGPGSRKGKEGQHASDAATTAAHAPAARADGDEREAGGRGAERHDISLGDAGSVSVIVNVDRWWDLPDDQLLKLRKLIKDIEALGDSGI